MSISSQISDRFWNLPQKAQEEIDRERYFIDDIIQKAHIQRLLLENLDGVETAFDGGGGYGRFSLLLAAEGVHVTHFDLSLPMLEAAKRLAEERDLSERMTFVHGSLEDLSAFGDRQFDLAMSFDAPISYTYPNQERVIGELARIASKKLVISVSSLTGSLPYAFMPSGKAQYMMDPEADDHLVRWYMEWDSRPLKPDLEEANRMYSSHLVGNLAEAEKRFSAGEADFPPIYCFSVEELRGILERCGGRNIQLSGPGALSRSIPNRILIDLMKDADQKAAFLDLCYRYDSEPSCAGMGKDNLLAVADLQERNER